MAAIAQHVVLALVLTGVLAYQAGVFLTVLRFRRALAFGRRARITDLVWVTIPVAVVIVLAARSWLVVLDLGTPAMAGVEPLEISSRLVSAPIFHR